jgi:hypothetical protein
MWLPEAMSIGVDYSIFWKLNPKKLEAFAKAYRKRIENEMKLKREEINFSAWLSGMYFGEMASSLLSKKHRYPKAPHPLEPPTEQQRFERAKNKMLSWANKVNANIAAREQIANEKEV